MPSNEQRVAYHGNNDAGVNGDEGQRPRNLTPSASSMRLREAKAAEHVLRDENEWYHRHDIRNKSLLRDLVKATSIADVAVLLERSRGALGLKDASRATDVDDGPETEILDDTSFVDLHEFRNWLHESGVDTIHWGLARTKSIASLFREIQNKTSVLLLEPTGTDAQAFRIIRLLRVVRVRLKQEVERGRVRYLVEGSQELGETGQLRYRNMLLSSMMRYGENAFNAAKRSVEKEMQNINTVRGRCIPRRAIAAKRGNTGVCIEDLKSPSYPGLLTRYVLVTVDVALDRRLPDGDFCTVEYLPTMHIATKHYWKWRTRSEVDQILSKKTVPPNGQGAARKDATEASTALLSGISRPFFLSLCDEDFEPLANSDESEPSDSAVFITLNKLKRHMRQWGLSKSERKDLLVQAAAASQDQKQLSKADFFEIISPQITALVIADADVLAAHGLGDEHFIVLRNLFPNACRIYSRVLHGGFSGSFVLSSQGRYHDGTQGDPTVIKIDRRGLMRDEIERFTALAPYMGECAPAILQTDVEPSDLEFGGIKFELVGAVWMLPDFRANLLNSGAAQPLSTFKSLFLHESLEEERVNVEHALGRLGASSPHILDEHATTELRLGTGFQIGKSPSSPDSLGSPITAGTEEDDAPPAISGVSSFKGEERSSLVYGQAFQVLKEVFGEILRTTTLSSKRRDTCCLVDIFKLDKYVGRLLAPPSQAREAAACEPAWDVIDPEGEGRAVLRRFLDKIDRREHTYETGLVHGDLNGMNVLIDSHNIVWLIDFAFSGRSHVLTDIAKLESCILYEYVTPRSEVEYEALRDVADILLNVDDLREVLHSTRFDAESTAAPGGQLARVEYAWRTIKQLRMYAANYCDSDPEPAQMLLVMLHFAVRAVRFQDTEDKRLPFHVATQCAQRLLDLMQNHQGSVKVPVIDRGEASRHKVMNASLSEAQIKYEKHRYFHDVRVRESYILDLFTREPVNILEQTVELQVIEGNSKEKVLRDAINMDELQAQKRLQKRLDVLRGDILGPAEIDAKKSSLSTSTDDCPHSRFTSALQVLGNPRDEGYRVILGGAASGKSCLMRKILVSLGQDLASDGDDVIPILILVIELGRIMTERKLDAASDLIDAYFVRTFGERSARLAFFRQMRAEGCLCYLFDGLDEAGDHKSAIEQYLAELVVREKRIVISSRETGFNEAVFRQFQFLQVLPLTDQMQSQIVEMRLGSDHPRLFMIRAELRKQQYAEIVSNPLMLSLLVSLLANRSLAVPQGPTAHDDDDDDEEEEEDAEDEGKEEEGELAVEARPDLTRQRAVTRSDLYDRAVAQLLYHGSMAKFGMRRGADDKHVQRSIETLASKLSYGFLKNLAFATHSKRLRDFGPEILNQVTESYVLDRVYFPRANKSTALQMQQEVFHVVEVLQGAVFSGLCGLFATSRVSSSSTTLSESMTATAKPTSQLTIQQVLRFVHLSFQEYLAGLHMVDHLQHALTTAGGKVTADFLDALKAIFRLFPEREDWGHLHDPWWQATIRSMTASMSPELFLAFTESVLSWEDPSGTNVLLCAELQAEIADLPEIGATMENEAPKSPRAQARQLIRDRFSKYMNASDLVDALTHPSRNLQLMALTEVHKLYDPRKAAFSVMFGQEEACDSAPLMLLPWYRRVAAAYALGHLSSARNDEIIIEVLLSLWSDESPQVRHAAVEAIAALQAENSKLVVDEVLRQLYDEVESENGHELVSALRLQHPRIVEALLHIAALQGDEAGRSTEALHSLPLTVELMYALCRAVSHSKTLAVRCRAAEILLSRCVSAASADESAPLDETIETAFISWLEHPEVSFCKEATHAIAHSRIKSFRIAQALFALQERATMLPGDHAGLWDAALRALCVVAQPKTVLLQEALQAGLASKQATTRAESLRQLQTVLRVLNAERAASEMEGRQHPEENIRRIHGDQGAPFFESAEGFALRNAGSKEAAKDADPRGQDERGERGSSRLSKYAEILHTMAHKDEDPAVALQALKLVSNLPQFDHDISRRIFLDESAPPQLRAAALRLITERDKASLGTLVPTLTQWITEGPRPLVNSALATLVNLRESAVLAAAICSGAGREWSRACQLSEAVEQHTRVLKTMLTSEEADSILNAFVGAFLLRRRAGETGTDSLDAIAELAYCDGLGNLGDDGLCFSSAKTWLELFAQAEPVLQIALSALLSGEITVHLEKEILGAIKDASSDKRVRASLALAMYRHGRWGTDGMKSAMQTWLMEEDEIMQLAAVDVLSEIGDVGGHVVQLLPRFLQGSSPSKRDIAPRERLTLRRKGTKARMRIAVLSHLRMHSEGASLGLLQTVHGKLALRESIVQGIQSLMMHPRFSVSEEELLGWLNKDPHSQLVACEILLKANGKVARTQAVAQKLFALAETGSDSTSAGETDHEGEDTASSSGVADAAILALVTRFRRSLMWSHAAEANLLRGSDPVREACLVTLGLGVWLQDAARFAEMIPLVRSACLRDASRAVRLSAVAICVDWLRALREPHMDVSVANAQESNVRRVEECLKETLGVPDRDPSELVAVVDLVKGAASSQPVFKAVLKLMHDCPDEKVRARCQLVLSQLRQVPMANERDLLDLEIYIPEAKLLWLKLLKKMRREKGVLEISISGIEIVDFTSDFVNADEAKEYSVRNAGLVLEILRLFMDLRVVLDPSTIGRYFEVAGAALNASDDRVYRLLLHYLLVSDGVRLCADIVQRIVELALTENDALETERSRNAVHFFAQYQVKDVSEAAALVDVLGSSGNTAQPFLFEPILSFLRRERARRHSEKLSKSYSELRARIDELAQAQRALETAYLSKEIRFGFEMHDGGISMGKLVLKGRGKIQAQRIQRQALKDMREAEWEQARAGWFHASKVDQLLEFTNVPSALEYQQSRLATAQVNIFLNGIPDEMVTERQMLTGYVLPELRRRLKALGVPVSLHVCNPALLGTYLEPSEASSASSSSSAGAALTSTANQRVALARACAPYMVSLVGARYGDPLREAPNEESIEMLERAAAFLDHPCLPTNSICYFRDATFVPDLVAHLAVLGSDSARSATSHRTAELDLTATAMSATIEDGDLTALSHLERSSIWEHESEFRLKAQHEREIQAIKEHGFAKSGHVRLSTPASLRADGSVSPSCLLDFAETVTEDLLTRLLGEFPVRSAHRAKHAAGLVCGSEEVAESLPFNLLEEQRAQEHFLWEHSTLARGDADLGGLAPRCRQHIYHDLQHLLVEDGSSDNRLRAERRTVTNPKFWTKDDHLGNAAIFLTADRFEGKTTVLATFTDWYRSTCSPSLPPIIYHACGASASSSDLTFMLLRLGVELLNAFQPRFGDETWLPPSGSAVNLTTVRAWWHGLLCEVSTFALAEHRRPVLVIDGVFDSSAFVRPEEIWGSLIPSRYGGRCPPGISMLLSAFKESPAKGLARANPKRSFPFREVALSALDQEERTSLLTEAFARYHLRPTEELSQRAARSGVLTSPAQLDVFARHLATLPGGHASLVSTVNEVLAMVSHTSATKVEPRSGMSVASSATLVSESEASAGFSEASALDIVLRQLEAEFGVTLCRTVLSCLALVGHMDELDLFEFSAQSSNSISSSEWRRLSLQLESLVMCVSYCAQNEGTSWQRRGSSLRSIESHSSRNSRGPEARRISDLASQDAGGRRQSMMSYAGKRFTRHVSVPEELWRALHAESHSVRVLSLRSEWIKETVLCRYYFGETGAPPDESRAKGLAAFYGKLCHFWASKLDVWYASAAQIPLLTHRAAAMRRIPFFAMHADDLVKFANRTLLSPKTLAAMAAQSTWHDAIACLLDDFTLYLEALDEERKVRGSAPEIDACLSKVRFARERVAANVDEIIAKPACIAELI